MALSQPQPTSHIVRNPLVQSILRAYEEDRPRKRKE